MAGGLSFATPGNFTLVLIGHPSPFGSSLLGITNPKAVSRKRRGPEMQLKCDGNGIPVLAKCSAGGATMQQSTPRITNAIDNVAWFRDQFALHVAQCHPSKPSFGRLNG
jgi:hypothetical protein